MAEARARYVNPEPVPNSLEVGEASMRRIAATSPESTDLRRAIAWLIEQPQRDARTIEEASRRFDLSPLDEAFLLEHFRDPGGGGAGT